MVLFDIVLVPFITLIPQIAPVVVVVVLLVAFAILEMVLLEMVTVPVPEFLMPITFCTLLLLAELALMLLAVDTLPMWLLLMVVVPAVPDL
jgi:hypothetical protein